LALEEIRLLALPEGSVLFSEGLDLGSLPHLMDALIDVDEGLGEIVKGPTLNGRDRILNAAVRSHQDHLNLRPVPLGIFEQLNPCHPLHSNIGDKYIYGVALKELDRFRATEGGVDLKLPLLWVQEMNPTPLNGALVVYNKYPDFSVSQVHGRTVADFSLDQTCCCAAALIAPAWR